MPKGKKKHITHHGHFIYVWVILMLNYPIYCSLKTSISWKKRKDNAQKIANAMWFAYNQYEDTEAKNNMISLKDARWHGILTSDKQM
jgi:hypothetical protein